MSQDKSELAIEALENNLVEQLNLINLALQENTQRLKEHYDRHGDFYFRKKLEDGTAEITDRYINFGCKEFKNDIKVLLDNLLTIKIKMAELSDKDHGNKKPADAEPSGSELLLGSRLNETKEEIMDSQAKKKTRTRKETPGQGI